MSQLSTQADVRARGTVDALIDLGRAARIHKNASLLVLTVSGALWASPARDVAWGAVLAGSALLLLAAVWTTHINNLTDAELDRATKPEMARWMGRDAGLTRAVVVAEGVALVAGLVALGLGRRPALAVALAAASLCGLLYSYNLLSAEPVARRWKAHWASHAAAFLGGYASIWAAGFACGAGVDAGAIGAATPVFLLAALSDYALYLAESTVDAPEERAAGLRTLPVVLGVRRTLTLSVALGALGVAGLGWTGDARAILVFLPGSLLRLAYQAWLAATDGPWEAHRARVEAFADSVFHLGRLAVVVGLVVVPHGL